MVVLISEEGREENGGRARTGSISGAQNGSNGRADGRPSGLDIEETAVTET